MSDLFATGKGATPGGPSTPFINEQEMTAAAVQMRKSLGVIPPDVYDMTPISDMNRQMVWKYTSDATKTVLAPLRHLPTSTKPTAEKDTAWVNEFQQLINYLPDDVRARYLEESRLPYAERDKSYLALDELLGLISDFMVWSKRSTAPLDPASASATQIAMYQAFPGLFQDSMLTLSKDVIAAVQGYLTAVGPNDPNFYTLTDFVKRLEASLNDVRDGNLENLHSIVEDLDSWKSQLSVRSIGDQMQILHTSVDLLAIVASAAALTTGARSLFLGLSIGTIGLDFPQHPLGALPEPYTHVRNLFTQLYTTILLPNADAGSQHYISVLLSMVCMVCTSIGSLSTTNSSPLLLETGLLFLVASDFLGVVCDGIVSSCGANAHTGPIAKELLTATAVLLTLHAAMEKERERAREMIEILSPYLEKTMNNLEVFFRDAAESHSFLSMLSVLVSQGKHAIEQKDYETFLNVLHEVATTFEQDQKMDFPQALKHIGNFSNVIWQQAVEKGDSAQLQGNIGVYQG